MTTLGTSTTQNCSDYKLVSYVFTKASWAAVAVGPTTSDGCLYYLGSMMINETWWMIVILTTNIFAVIEKVLLNECNLKYLQSFQIM